MKKTRKIDPKKAVLLVRNKLGHLTFEKDRRFWLQTPYPRLNAVMGSPTKGLAFGRIYELHGPESSGKTLLALTLMGLAQKEYDAYCIWFDAEKAWDAAWAERRGVDPEQVFLYEHYAGRFGKEKEKRIASSEEVFQEIEHLVKGLEKYDPRRPIFIGVDSIAALNPAEENDTEVTNRTARTEVTIPRMLSPLLRRWKDICDNYNVLMLLINQMRDAPFKMFGSPERTPGGRAIKHYAASRVKVQRKGVLRKGGRQTGVHGIMTNVKNKVGEGSVEHFKVEYKLYFNRSKVHFSK